MINTPCLIEDVSRILTLSPFDHAPAHTSFEYFGPRLPWAMPCPDDSLADGSPSWQGLTALMMMAPIDRRRWVGWWLQGRTCSRRLWRGPGYCPGGCSDGKRQFSSPERSWAVGKWETGVILHSDLLAVLLNAILMTVSTFPLKPAWLCRSSFSDREPPSPASRQSCPLGYVQHPEKWAMPSWQDPMIRSRILTRDHCAKWVSPNKFVLRGPCVAHAPSPPQDITQVYILHTSIFVMVAEHSAYRAMYFLLDFSKILLMMILSPTCLSSLFSCFSCNSNSLFWSIVHSLTDKLPSSPSVAKCEMSLGQNIRLLNQWAYYSPYCRSRMGGSTWLAAESGREGTRSPSAVL